MPGLSKVIVLDPDARAGRQIQLGFEREGVPVAALPTSALAADAKFALPGDETGLVMVGGVNGVALDLVRRARSWLDEHKVIAPLVFAGRGVTRTDARAAGADEIVQQPAYLRDVVTIGRLMCGRPAEQRQHLVGNLMEISGVFTLVRALAALGRSATLTLVRGLRRGEIRFYHGEVTSAQVGMIHGLAALHQLLLWTDARFDYHHEDIVRRQQIPLEPDELFSDAERFLESVRDSSGGLSPAMILEQDLPRVQSFGKQIPTEVYGVLRMFDGYRVLADVLEDSAYRVFETLRVAQRAVEIGLLRVSDKPLPRTSWRPVLPIEDWLIGRAAPETGPVAREAEARAPSKKSRRNKKSKKRTDTPAAGAAVSSMAGSGVDTAGNQIDWAALIPREVGAEVGSLSGVVPAAQASGEITGGGAIDRKVPDAGPKVVFDEARERALAAERQRAAAADRERAAASAALAHAAAARAAEEAAASRALAAAAKEQADAAAKAKAKADEDAAAAAKAKADEDAAAKATADGEALRIVAETVSPSQEPSAVSGELKLIDTKRERLPRAATVKSSEVASGTLDTPGLDPESAVAPSETQATETEAVTVAESDTEILIVRDRVVVDTTSATTVRVIATPIIEVRRAPTPVPIASAPSTPSAPSAPSSTPSELADDPSDGVIIQHITTADTAPVKRRRRPPSDPVPDDRPGDATGEITMPRARAASQPRASEPSILVADLDTVQDVASGQVTIPTKATDAHAPFSEVEEEFFRAGHEDPATPETFDDLDEGYRKVSFWDRLRGRIPRRPDTSDPVSVAPPPSILPSATPAVAASPLAAEPAPAISAESTAATEPTTLTTEPAPAAPEKPAEAPSPPKPADPKPADPKLADPKPARPIQPRPPSRTQQTLKGRPDQQRKPGKKKR